MISLFYLPLSSVSVLHTPVSGVFSGLRSLGAGGGESRRALLSRIVVYIYFIASMPMTASAVDNSLVRARTRMVRAAARN